MRERANLLNGRQADTSKTGILTLENATFINFETPITITCKDKHKFSQSLIKKNLPRRAIYNNNINVICIY
jgi:hypothetical protein